MSRRKGELSNSAIDHDFPHQVMVLAADCAGNAGQEKQRVALEGLNVCIRHHTVMKDGEWRLVFCFAEKAHADLFRRRFGGEPFDPSSRSRGSNWAAWREPKRRRVW